MSRGDDVLLDLLVVFLAASGVVFLIWCLLGCLLHPVFCEEMVTYLPVRGDGSNVEQSVRAYAWLRSGRLSGGTLVLVDLGLDRQGLQCVEAICKHYDWIFCCPSSEAPDYILQ